MIEFFATALLGTTSVSVGWRVAADFAVLDDLRVVGEVALEPFVFGQRLLQLFAQAKRSPHKLNSAALFLLLPPGRRRHRVRNHGHRTLGIAVRRPCLFRRHHHRYSLDRISCVHLMGCGRKAPPCGRGSVRIRIHHARQTTTNGGRSGVFLGATRGRSASV